MADTTQPADNSKLLLYLIGIVMGLGVVGLLLVLLYLGLSYLALNLFLWLDLSLYGRAVAAGAWPGYALLGLGLGAAAGAVAAHRRFRLGRPVLAGAGLLAVALVAGALVGNAAHFAPSVLVATAYVRGEGQGQCPACLTIEASSTKADSVQNRYNVASLLDKDPATAWISAADTGQTLRLQLSIPADQRLVGLRLGNGYGKNEGVYTSFSRVRCCRVGVAGGPETQWTLPDTHQEDLFIPLSLPTEVLPVIILLRIDNTYAGENHLEVALSALTPIIEPKR